MTAQRQLLVDVTVLAGHDDQSGVQRVVRNLLHALQAAPPPGWRVAAVADVGGYYAYTPLPPAAGGDAEGGGPAAIHVRDGDIFLGLDLCPDQVPGNRAVFEDLRRHGVQICFVVYDLLPLQLPAMFAAGASPWFARWLETVAGVGDRLFCISNAVADEVLAWLEQHPVANPGTLRIGHFHLGADLGADPAGERQLSAAEAATLEQLPARPSLLMVGTLEPRKMHAQALDAFEQLWADGGDAALVIAGKPGWMTEALTARIEQHPQLGRRLFWLRHASDAALLRLYAGCSGLLAASAGEGYGLPLIEAARHGLPILARELPVFREVCGEHASYFSGDAPELAAALKRWLQLRAAGRAPASAAIPALTWAASAQQLLALLQGRRVCRTAPTLLP
jgi:glycosyltransferase involved in cell wall biosynthesis